MKKTGLFVWLSIGLLLSGCSLRGDAADLYSQETPLQVEVAMPETVEAGSKTAVEVILRQDGKLVEGADYVHFEILDADGSVHSPMEEAAEKGKGVYGFEMQFENDGLYYLAVHAGNDGSAVNPRHRFIVGTLSEEEAGKLEQGPAPEKEAGGAHH